MCVALQGLDALREAIREQRTKDPNDYKALYHELIYAVASKYPNESRHQTALRYITRAETSSGEASAVGLKR